MLGSSRTTLSKRSNDCGLAELLYGSSVRKVDDFGYQDQARSYLDVEQNSFIPQTDTSCSQRIDTFGFLTKTKSTGDLLTSFSNIRQGQRSVWSSQTPVNQLLSPSQTSVKLLPSPHSSQSAIDFALSQSQQLNPVKKGNPLKMELSRQLNLSLGGGGLIRQNSLVLRVGGSKLNRTKSSVGEEAWAQKIAEVKASIKKKMPAFSSKLLNHYDGYLIDQPKHYAPRSTANFLKKSSLLPLENLNKLSFSIGGKVNQQYSSSSQVFSSSSLSMKRQQLEHLTAKIGEFQEQADTMPVIPESLLSQSRKQSNSAFFEITNLKLERKTLKFLAPTYQPLNSGYIGSSCSVLTNAEDVDEAAASVPQSTHFKDFKLSKNSKHISNTYKTFRTSIRNFHNH